MGKKNMILLFILVCLIFPVTTVYPYGGGGGGGGVGGGASESGASQMDDGSFGGGAVSWAPNPNGVDVRGSSIWSGRPEGLEKGPYQPDKAVEDAEQDLLDGFNSGQYSADAVKANLEWAQSVGISISDQAQQTLNAINNPPTTPVKQQTTPVKPNQFTEKQQNKVVKFLDIANQYFNLKEKRKRQGKNLTKADLYSIGAKTVIKDKVPKGIQKYVDKAFDALGF